MMHNGKDLLPSQGDYNRTLEGRQGKKFGNVCGSLQLKSLFEQTPHFFDSGKSVGGYVSTRIAHLDKGIGEVANGGAILVVRLQLGSEAWGIVEGGFRLVAWQPGFFGAVQQRKIIVAHLTVGVEPAQA